MSNMMKVKDETKEKLEIIKTTYKVGSLSDAVEAILYDNAKLTQQIEKMKQEKEQLSKQLDSDFIKAGTDRKEQLKAIAIDYSLIDQSEVIDLLLDVYYSTPTIDRTIFDKWMLKKNA